VEAYLSDGTSIRQGKILLGKFRAPLSKVDEQRCLDFLTYIFPEDQVDIGRVRQNDLADWLLQQEKHVLPTTETILGVIADESADLRWREFCVQKLALAIEQPFLEALVKEKCIEILREKAGDPRISFSGAALLGLLHAVRVDESLMEMSTLAELAEHVLNTSDFATANKVTALQVAGLAGSEQAVELARAYLLDDTMPIQLRVSAVALLGQKGDQQDVTKLEPFINSPDFRLRKAAEAAVLLLTS
jgi:hypothetical protein